jgi:hypothetical protein
MMFQRMDSKQRKQQLDQHSAGAAHGRHGWMAGRSPRPAYGETNRAPAAPEPGWAPPQKVKHANQQFHEFPDSRDDKIDAATQELLQLNNRMVARFDRIFGSSGGL